MIFKSEGKQSDLNGFLDSGSHVQGELRFQTSFRVDGTFNGSVVSDGDLIVGDGGEVEGWSHGERREGDCVTDAMPAAKRSLCARRFAVMNAP